MAVAPIGLNGTHNRVNRYGTEVLALLRKKLVTNEEDIFSTDFEGNPTAGAVQIPVRDTEVVVGNYDIGTGKALTQSATTYLQVLIDQHKAINEIIDGYEAAAVSDNVAAQRLGSATYSLGLTIDSDAIATLEAGGTTSDNVTASTDSTIYKNILAEQVELDEADVEREGRYNIIKPSVLSLLKTDANFVSAGADTGFNEVKKAGLVGMVDGVMTYMSNNLSSATEFILGSKMFSQRIMEWAVEPTINDLTNEYIGSSAVQGRMIYKHVVTREAAVRVKTVDLSV